MHDADRLRHHPANRPYGRIAGLGHRRAKTTRIITIPGAGDLASRLRTDALIWPETLLNLLQFMYEGS